ncbi:DUF1748-domain-containing protein [Thelephora terrestris]|uniref:DUF1748-domain-containing protein n=1 Tax=Thelephora terrestris TaxID=56493 RepID=A0A9P6HID3_9AGAM|nr:DUF1748-domain-containing protein [Thelephora terrestris]
MVLGRLVHYVADAVLVSTVLAGIKRSTGFAPDTAAIAEPRVRSVVDGFLGVGDSVFAMSQSAIVNSPYFKKSS